MVSIKLKYVSLKSFSLQGSFCVDTLLCLWHGLGSNIKSCSLSCLHGAISSISSFSSFLSSRKAYPSVIVIALYIVLLPNQVFLICNNLFQVTASLTGCSLFYAKPYILKKFCAMKLDNLQKFIMFMNLLDAKLCHTFWVL